MTARRLAALAPVLLFLVTTFLFMPRALIGLRTYAAVDILELTPPYRDAIDHRPSVVSPIQGDQAEGLPGLVEFFRTLRGGSFQRWDPSIGGGTPTGIFPFNGLLSPFSAGFLLLPAWYAVTLKVALALFTCQWFTHLLMRRLGAGRAAAALTGIAYTFSGTNLVFIHRIGAVFVLPALLWATHRLVRGPTVANAALVAVTTAWVWFEGFPAGFAYCVWTAAVWALWLLVNDARVRRRGREPWLAPAVRRGLAFGGAAAWGSALASVTLLPFLIEVVASGVLGIRRYDSGNHLFSVQFFGLFDLSAVGPPNKGPWWSGANPVESVSHVGSITVLLLTGGLLAAAAGRLRLSRDGADAWSFMCVLGTAGIVLTFLRTPLLTLAYRVPGIAGNPLWRARFVICLAAAVLAGLALDCLWRDGYQDRRPASRAVPALSLAVGIGIALWWGPAFIDRAHRAEQLDLLATGFGWAALLGVLAVLVAVLGALRGQLRPLAAGGLAALLFVQLALPLRTFTPEAPVSDFYTDQRGHQALRRLLDGRFRFVAANAFLPNTSQLTGLIDARGFGLHSEAYRRLIEAATGAPQLADLFKIQVPAAQDWNLDSPLLDDLSVRYFVLASYEMPFGRHDAADSRFDEWRRANELEHIDGVAPGPMAGLVVPIRLTGDCDGAHVSVRVEANGRLLDVSTRPAFDLVQGWNSFAVTAQALRAGDQYRLGVVTDRASCLPLAGVTVDGGVTRPAVQPIVPEEGSPVRLVETEQGWIYERPSAFELVSARREWRSFSDTGAMLGYASRRPAAERGVASFVGDGPTPEPGSAPARIEGYTIGDHRVEVPVDTEATSLVVISQNYRDGWTARVDGVEQDIVLVDGALMGVFVPTGRHRLVVTYEPTHFAVGWRLSLLALAGVAVVALGALAPRVRATAGRLRVRQRGSGGSG